MIFIYSFLVFASIAPALIVGLRRRRFYSAFLALLAYYCMQIPFLLIGPLPYPETQIFPAVLFVTIANAMLSLCIVFGERWLSASASPDPVREISPIWVTLGFGAVAFLYLAGKMWQGAVGLENVWEQREYDFGFLTSALTYVGFLLFVLWTPLRTVAKLAVLPLLVFVFVTTGARVMFMVIAGYLFYEALRRFRLRTIIAFAPFALAVLLFVHVVARTARSVGARTLLSGDFSAIFDDLTGQNLDITGGESGIAEAFVMGQQLHMSGLWDLPPFTTLIRLILLPVPTSTVAIKPPDVTYTLWGQALQAGFFDFDSYFATLVESYSLGQNGSLHPIIWGDAFLNAGWIGGLIWPILLALLLLGIERALVKYGGGRFASMLAGLAAPALVYIMRGNVFLGVAFFVLLPFLWYLTLPRVQGVVVKRRWLRKRAT